MDLKAQLAQERVNQILDNALDAMITMDQEQKVIQWNQQAAAMFGYSREEARGRLLPELIIPPKFRDMHNAGVRRFLKTGAGPMFGKTVTTCAVRRDGSEFPCELRVQPIEVHGHPIEKWMFTASIRDISREVEDEAFVRQSREQIDDFVHHGPLAMHWVNEAGIILWANQAELDMLGYAAGEYIGHSIFEFHINPNLTPEALQQMRGQHIVNYPSLMKTRDGRIRHVLIDSNVLEQNGQFIHTRTFTRDVTDQMESEERFKATFDQAAVGIVHLSPTDQVIRANSKFCDMLGYSLDEMAGMHTPDVCHPDDLTVGLEYVEPLQKDEIQTCQIRRRYFNKAGNLIWLDLTVSVVRNTDRSIKYYIIVAQDVTEQQHQKEALEQQAHLLNLSNDAIFAIDANGLIEYWNAGAERLYDYTAGEALHQAPASLLKTEWPLNVTSQDVTAIVRDTGAWSGELTHSDRHGQRHTVLARFVQEKDSHGQHHRTLATMTDISDRRQYEAKLRESEARYRATFHHAAVGIAHVSLEGHWVEVNDKLCEMLGYTKAELENGMTFQDVTHPDDLKADNRLYDQTRVGLLDTYNMEKRYIRCDGSIVWVSLTVSAVRDDHHDVQYVIAVIEEITSRRMAEEQTSYLANHDPLTGLANRAYFAKWLHDALADAQRSNLAVAVMVLDLDKFKFVNDNYGHHVGDMLLKEVANRLINCVRTTDLVARMGGDEFNIVLTHLNDPQDAEVVAQKITQSMAQPFYFDGKTLRTAVSIGITLYPDHDENMSQLLKNADMAMYKAKMSGRNRYRFYCNDMRDEFFAKTERERQLHQAFADSAFTLAYQPQVDVKTAKIVGVETLLRCTHAPLKGVSTFEVIAMAEETGLIVPMGEWVLRNACKQFLHWQSVGAMPFSIAVNFSPRQFNDPGFLTMVKTVLAETQMPPQFLEVEITEGLLMENSLSNSQLLTDIKALGLKLSIDDFGTGFSSLQYLKNFPIDTLKIDKCFVDGLPNDRSNIAITCAIMALCSKLGIEVIAEGVEEKNQFFFLKQEGCHTVQGWLFSKAIDADELTRQLMAHPDGQIFPMI